MPCDPTHVGTQSGQVRGDGEWGVGGGVSMGTERRFCRMERLGMEGVMCNSVSAPDTTNLRRWRWSRWSILCYSHLATIKKNRPWD